MSELISRTQAVVRVMMATKLARADAEEWLDDAFPVRPPPVNRDPVDLSDPLRLYAGGMTYVDLEADQKVAALLEDDVDLDSLEEALADLLATTTTNAPPPRKKVDRSFDKQDRPLVEQMHPHVLGGLKPNAAALLFVDKAVGGGSTESKQRRLQRLYSKLYGAT
jgi:hypothetical protein